MTQVTATCYSFIGGSPKLGMQAVWQDPKGVLHRPFGSTLGDAPIKRMHINLADNTSVKKAVLVSLEPPRLICGEPLAKSINLWPGGEWHDFRPFKRFTSDEKDKRRIPYERLDIFLLFAGQQLAIVDGKKAIKIVSVLQNDYEELELVTRSPEAIEVLSYLAQDAQRQTTHRGVTWAMRNFEAIAKAQRVSSRRDVKNMLTQIERRLKTVQSQKARA